MNIHGETIEAGEHRTRHPVSVLPTATTVMPAPPRPRLPFAVAALGLVTAAYLAMLAVRPGGGDLTVQVSDVATAVAAVVAALTCAWAGRRHLGAMRAFWWLLATACVAWASGEAIWSWYEVVLQVEVPYPSWADVGYLAGTPLAVAAFACHPAAHRRHAAQLLPLLDGIAVASALLFVSWTLVLGPLWSQNGGMLLGDLVAVAYPFGDVVLLVLVVLALRNLEPGNRAATTILLGGLIVMAVTDTGYTYLAQVGAYSSGDLIDAGWFASYLAIAVAAILDERPIDAGRSASTSPVSALAPTVPVLVALVVIAVELPRGRVLGGVEWGIAVFLTVIVVVRQLLYVGRSWGRSRTPAETVLSRASQPVASSPSSTTVPGRLPTDSRGELQALTLQLVAAAQPTAQERAARVSRSMVTVLTSVAGGLAVWDLSLLVRGAG